MTHPVRPRLRSERGSVLIGGLLLSIALVMVIGLGVDVGHAFLVRRQLTSIADDAALSGSQAIDLPELHAGHLELEPHRSAHRSATNDHSEPFDNGPSDRHHRVGGPHRHPHGADHPARNRRSALADDLRARDRSPAPTMKPAPAISAVAGALAFLTVGVRLGLDPLAFARVAVLGAALGVIVRDDLREHRIPNRVVLPATIACATLSLIGGLHVSSLIGGGAVLALLLARRSLDRRGSAWAT